MQRIATTVIPYTELEVAGPYNSATNTGNFDTSRATIDRVIIHTMDGTWEGAAARFDNPSSNVSAHYGVKLDGTLIHWLEEYNTAYHAGDYAMNQRSIGIEHEDGGDYNGVRPDVLYATSAKLVRDICQFYNIPIDREHIKKHNEVSDKPTGCPDALDIDRIVREAQAADQNTLAEKTQEANENWDCFLGLETELGIPVDPNDKKGSMQKGINAIEGYKDQIKQLQETNKKQLEALGVKSQALQDINEKDGNLATQNLALTKQIALYKNLLDDVADALNDPTPLMYTQVDGDHFVNQIHTLQTPVETQVKPLQDHALDLVKQLPSLEKARTSKKDKTLIQKVSDFLGSLFN